MRWAKFKTAVLIFLAGRLARWADSIERRIDYGDAGEMPAVEDAADESFPDDETRSGVPEHWARLIARRPPQHWLDLIRERAPHRLSKTDALSEEGAEVFDRETLPAADEVPLTEDDVVKRSRQETLRPKNKRDELGYYAQKSRRATWLKRLRFQPRAPLGNSPPVYLRGSETREPLVASEPGQEERRAVAPRKLARLFPSSIRKANHRDDGGTRWANTESAAARPHNEVAVVHSQDRKQSGPSHEYPATNYTRVRNDAVKVPPEAEHRKSPSLRLLRSDERKRSSLRGFQPNADGRTTHVTPVSPLALPHVDNRRARAVSSRSEPQTTDTDRTTRGINVRTIQQARNQSTFLDFTSSEYNASLTESGESVWPDVPVAPDCEVADEVAATQREAERLRKLELEQRGDLWNA